MKSQRRTVLEVLFPEVRAKLFRLLFAAPVREHYVRELMLRSGLALHTVQDELRKLSAIGLLTSRSNGFHRFYQANRKHALYHHIREIVELSKQLPRTHQTALGRPTSKPASNPKRPHKRIQLRPDRPLSWGVFEKHQS